jgi:uncharacterized protein
LYLPVQIQRILILFSGVELEKMRLGKTGLMVSRLGFGGIPIQRVTEDRAIAVVRRAMDLGINFFDTANGYTNSEARIGKAVSVKRESVILATKTQARTNEDLEAHVQLSLQRFGVDYIDLYQFHNVADLNTLDKILDRRGLITVLEKAKKQGIIKHIGITSHQMDTAKAAVKTGRFETIMFPFNFITAEPETELLPLARAQDMGFIVMKHLSGGALKDIKMAFKYLFQFPDILPIPGIERAAEIEEIVQLLNDRSPITPVERKKMEKVRLELGNKFCRRCDYCQPCTAEIPISMVLFTPHIMDDMPKQIWFSGPLAGLMDKAASCTDCGKCEERCPYHLPIREMMKEYLDMYQAEKQKFRAKIV